MRKTHIFQVPLTEKWLDLGHAKEYAVISRLLDEKPKMAELILQDLSGSADEQRVDTGAEGLSAEQVLRVLVVKQMEGFSYRELAFHIADSRTFQTFCRFGIADTLPSKSALHAAVKCVRAETLEAMHRLLLASAQSAGVESGAKARVDCTVVESNIHTPQDSELLWDCVRVMTRCMSRARKVLGHDVVRFANRTRRAKRRRLEILNAKSPKVRQHAYCDLIECTEEVHAMGLQICAQLSGPLAKDSCPKALPRIAEDLKHFLGLTLRVLDQTRRRVLQGEKLAAEEKIVSIFEEHTDIIRKDRRATYYGHKICVTGGASSMILDCVVLSGNPADSTLTQLMVDRQEEIFARLPREVALDGGFASKENLKVLRAKGIPNIMFSKRRGLAIEDMTKSTWAYKRLRNFRAGIEGVISFLKRCFGLDRCTWRSLNSFKSYVWASIFSFNLLTLARHKLA